MNSTSFFSGILMVVGSAVVFFFRKKVYNFQKERGSKIFKEEYRSIHEFKAWFIIVLFFITGLILIIKSL